MCIIMCMRTNIDLADELLTEAGRFAHGRTKKAIVEEALRSFIESKSAEARRRSYGERLRALESRTASLFLRESPAELLRADRDRR
jgi:Arc/MetJ family transcription regulator